MNNVSIIGAGAWGTALALCAFRAGSQVTLWSISLDEVETINQRHENVYRLPGIALDPSLQATTDPQECAKADMVILAPPAQFMRSTCETFQKVFPPHIPLIIASKGIENGTACLMTEVIQDYFPKNPLLVLSGPSFASDVAKRLPTAVTLAAQDLALSQKIASLLSSQYFRLYASQDMIGTQVGGACKNIIAIACGIIEGRELGDNARSALVTRGLSEITRLGSAMGGRLETFLGLSGMGDITLTSLSSQSRNKSFGLDLGRGTPLDELLSNKKTLTEGVHTVSGTVTLAKKFQMDMPITYALNDLLNGEGNIDTLIENLLSRPLRTETA
ncbi:MAG TPA: NAD(P)H-dependent glycerol-3-phosphate dehydrogenase [Alphaproteobacteria bacterium]|nr:NAD(P)H-dependent glycerol-3-phosphate dehydrogenase [Alphaproteobacteria bacterium]